MKLLLCLMLLFAVMFSGCVESDVLTGSTYEGPRGDTLRFFEDHKMYYNDGDGLGAMGTYHIEDGIVYYFATYWSGDGVIYDTELHLDSGIYVLVDE